MCVYCSLKYYLMRNLPVDSKLFIENRKRFIAKMEKNSIAIFNSNDEMPMNGDALYPFIQSADLYWLCGIQQEDTMVVLFPDNPDKEFREVLVLTRPNELKEKWNGFRLRKDEATKLSGIQTIIWLDELDAMLQTWIHLADTIYLNTNENDRKGNDIATRDYRYIKEIKKRFPLHQYRRSAKIMRELRAIKTSYEIEVMQQAADITDNTFRRLLKFIKPGVMEYEIEAEIWHSFISQRADGPAYGSIIASGDNARVLHYVNNNQECKDGDLILMDFGASYAHYATDLTRTIPVNGKFSKRQKEVYNACLDLHRYCASILRPGITINEYHAKVGDKATALFLKIGLISKQDVKNEDPKNRAYRKYLYHGISHYLGVDVHDLGTKTEPIKAGAVFTIEPGIYIEEEKMGIRIENNYWITKSGNKDLMKNIPITVEQIESLMKGK